MWPGGISGWHLSPAVAIAGGAFDSGWLFLYLTPPVYLACLAGVIYIPIRRQWRLALFLAVWLAVTLGPPRVLGNVICYSSLLFILAGVPPLLVAAAYLLCELIGFLFLRFEQKIAVAVGDRRAVRLDDPFADVGDRPAIPAMVESNAYFTRQLSIYQWLAGGICDAGSHHPLGGLGDSGTGDRDYE